MSGKQRRHPARRRRRGTGKQEGRGENAAAGPHDLLNL
jgi:hypothetical protein